MCCLLGCLPEGSSTIRVLWMGGAVGSEVSEKLSRGTTSSRQLVNLPPGRRQTPSPKNWRTVQQKQLHEAYSLFAVKPHGLLTF